MKSSRTIGALATTAALAAGAVVAAAPASALGTRIDTPRLRVVCAAAHHGQSFSAVRFHQRGHWAADASVVVTLAAGNGEHPKVEMHTRTGPHGWFGLLRVLHSSNTGPWIAGTSYTWTTALYKGTAATARRGTVKLVNSC